MLIGSFGGSLANGLSISDAVKNHGKVNVHFAGLNASAATIASLGAAHISILEWGGLSSDQFSTLIADCEKIKADLEVFL